MRDCAQLTDANWTRLGETTILSGASRSRFPRTTSAGNLTVNAGSIYNQLAPGVTGVSPIMQAVNNLNLNATLGNLTNSGIFAATTGNVNLTSLNNLVIDNVNGSVQALMGNINVHQVDDILNTLNVNATGGDRLSQQL